MAYLATFLLRQVHNPGYFRWAVPYFENTT